MFCSLFFTDAVVFTKHLGIKKPPDYGQEVTQMFSQRNNPYCEFLSISKYNNKKISPQCGNP